MVRTRKVFDISGLIEDNLSRGSMGVDRTPIITPTEADIGEQQGISTDTGWRTG